jgi:Family of unknown function (DUF6151)
MNAPKHTLQCRCGTLKGHVSHFQGANRCVCYCRDCQAFAHFLGRAKDILDADGGTDVIQTRAANATFTDGQEALACMRLTPNGLLRWYAACCNTPIGNTLANSKISFVGLVHNCLESGGATLDESFGPVRAHVNTESTRGRVQSSPLALMAVILRFIALVTRARIDGSYRRSPFFAADTGEPVVAPRVLSPDERDQLLRHV